MKLAINASALGEYPKGSYAFQEQLLSHLLRLPCLLKHQIEVFTNRHLDLPKEVKQTILPAFQGYMSKGNPLRHFFWNQFVFPWLARKFDLVYCPTANASLYAPRQVITISDLLALHYPQQHPLQSAYFRFVLPVLLKNASGIIAQSNAIRNELCEQWHASPSRIHAVPAGFDHEHWSMRCTPNADAEILNRHGLSSYILAVGTKFPNSNLEVVLNAIGLLEPRLASHSLKNHPQPLQLAIVGAPCSYLKELGDYAHGLGFGERLRFLGEVSTSELPALYRNAAMLVHPCLTMSSENPVLEAMGCGCPVICSDIPSLREVTEDAAILCAPDDVSDWSESIFQIVTRPTVRNDYILRGITRSQQFSWEKSAESVAEILLCVTA